MREPPLSTAEADPLVRAGLRSDVWLLLLMRSGSPAGVSKPSRVSNDYRGQESSMEAAAGDMAVRGSESLGDCLVTVDCAGAL